MLAAVFSGGGARAAYQAGVMAAIADRRPDLECPVYTGVSAGAINASFLASHRGSFQEATRALVGAWSRLSIEQVFRSDVISFLGKTSRWAAAFATSGSSLFSPLRGLVDTAPLRSFLEANLDLGGLEENIRSGRVHSLALSATSWTTGEKVTWVQGRKGIRPWQYKMRRSAISRISADHVLASSALPLVFPAVKVENQWFGDGSVRQHSPLSPAIHLGAKKILAVAVRFPNPQPTPLLDEEVPYPMPSQIIGYLMHSVFLDSLDQDAERLTRINRLVAAIPEKARTKDARLIDFKVLRPSRDLASLAVTHRGLLPRTLRLAMRAIGVYREKNAQMLSYLLFAEPYVSELIEMGRQDVAAHWGEIAGFLDR